MKRVITLLALLLAGASFANDARITKSEYVDQWKATAIQQMIDNNIPASITLAQGILESGSGNSALAISGNNHFGIKCHGWTGKKMYLDDDTDNECFRVYKTADQSYKDHSEFLMGYSRYAFLFTYDVTDYKSWAKGLKKAGYATNPKYPDLLIGIIEDLNLDQYDRNELLSEGYKSELITSTDVYSNKHNVVLHESKVKYVLAQKGDTFYKISKEFGLNLSQLYRYNNFDGNKDVLEEGDIIYIQPKRRGRIFKNKEIVAKTDMRVEELSQMYATNVKSLKRLNNFTDGTVVSKGESVTLR
jgi:LysM repeat protein